MNVAERAPSSDRVPAMGADQSTVFSIRSFGRVGSTNDELRALAENGAAHGTVVCADEQMSGRGRQGRPWFSEPGNLYMSVLLRAARPIRHSAEVAFVAGLAVADAVDAGLRPPARARLKWPNDVQVDGAKIAGVLVELADGNEAAIAVIVGIGVNVSHAPSGLPYPATCLRAHGDATVAGTREHVLAAVAARWDQWLRDGFGAIRADWLRRGPSHGARLHVSQPDGTVDATFAGLDADGALLLQTACGVQRHIAGDVVALARAGLWVATPGISRG